MVIYIQLPHTQAAGTCEICTQTSPLASTQGLTCMVICTQPGRMYPSTTAGKWCSHPVSVSLMPAGSWSDVHLNSLSDRRVHRVHGMVQVQGSLQGPLGRRGCLLRQPSSRRLVALPGCQAPHLLLQGELLQGQLLVPRGLPLARLPMLLAQQLLLKLLLLGGACGAALQPSLQPAPVTAGALLVVVGGPQSLSRRLTSSHWQPMLELWLLGGNCSLAWLVLGVGLGGACRQCNLQSLRRTPEQACAP